jgi:pimeloyl-ACP methyl ester carboxylesterase
MATFRTPEGIDIAYDVAGSGPPLLLVHGISESRRSWDPLVAALAVDHTVMRYDLRGHGESGPGPAYDLGAMAGDGAALLAHLEIDPAGCLLVGHSLGGTVVSAFAAGMPCRGVINVDQSLDLGGFKEQLGQLEPMLRDPAQFDAAMAMVFDALAGPLPGAERARIEGLRRGDQAVVLAIWSPVLDQPLEALDAMVEQVAGAIAVPYLSLFGVDPGPEYGAWLATRIPTATVEVWADHGHYPHLVDPGRFLARLAAFEASRA